jgi:hypothetical protein
LEDPENVEELRAELRRRLQRFVEADLAVQAWEARVAAAVQSGVAPDFGPCPYDEADMVAIAMGRDGG